MKISNTYNCIKTLLLMIFIIVPQINAQTKFSDINTEIEKGNFNHAKELINKRLSTENLTDVEKYNLNFQIDVMNRIERDFGKSRSDIKEQLTKYFPNLTDKRLRPGKLINHWK